MGNNPTEAYGPGDVEWDRVETLPDDERGVEENQKVGLYAGLWYLLDDDENAVSNGYHRIEKKDEFGGRVLGTFKGYLGDKWHSIKHHK